MSNATGLRPRLRRIGLFGTAALVLAGSGFQAFAADKPPVAPDTVAPFTTTSRISASVEFSLRALAQDIERGIPQRLATIDEEVNCVHRRVLIFRVNANCDVWGYVERSGPVSLYGRGDTIYGSMPIYGEIEGQGANRFTARIHGNTEASATIEVEARPRLNPDWSLNLNVSDGFRWSEAPVLHVLGRDIPLAKYAEPRLREELGRIRSRAAIAARALDLHEKAATAWFHAFEPVELSANPQIWLQLVPQAAAFVGIRAEARILRGSLELTGSAQTFVGQQPPAVPPTELPALGRDIAEAGSFDVILPVRIGYDLIRDKLMQAVTAIPQLASQSIREVDVYPSAGKLVIGLRIAKASETASAAGQWIYLMGGLQVDAEGKAVRLVDLGIATSSSELAGVANAITAELRDRTSFDYSVAYQNLLDAANEKLTRPLKDGFRMEGKLSSATFEKLYLSADAVVIGLHATGTLGILYGM